mmetsp:Transcript_11804/g.20258  ORF Transcript_11804/g.20258 Transcript_11804/m.20258 type:complete len:129 (-) Transcript_11804:169-555(-)|eukprot:CAMPEP_0184700988 /NCGR_PEP_ID=MMETSP0313-20130426/17470_1 /TAXON_ID=2792 /ORGANISM="Porphyridium aerugineum, Strain SAG 1380-2" /LENGTH=128 /DNA_ID=CAMNT_0027160887 /DNA_START=170 /DNA_END=556 /DNA_ORIENTATION=+
MASKIAFAAASAFTPSTQLTSNKNAFLCTTTISSKTATQNKKTNVSKSNLSTTIHMGKVAKFGIFSPAVIAVRFVIGEKRFDKIRGKGISLHSEVITNFCEFVGTSPKTKQGLIRLAKNNGSTLGFLS